MSLPQMREVSQDDWAEFLNTQTVYACESRPDVMEHREWGTRAVKGQVVYADDGSRSYYIPVDAPSILKTIHKRLSQDPAYAWSVTEQDSYNMRLVLRAWGYNYTVEAARLQLDFATNFDETGW